MAFSQSARRFCFVFAAIALAACSSTKSFVPATTPEMAPQSVTQTDEGVLPPGEEIPDAPDNPNVTATGPIVFISDVAGRLWTVNVGAKTIHLVGNMRALITDLGFDPINHVLYGVSFTGFYRINTATGLATFIGPLGISDANALVFSKLGRGYAKGYLDTNLYTVNNVATGRLTLIGHTGPWRSAGDLTFYNSALVLSGYTGNFNAADRDSLVFISRTNGAVSAVRSTNLQVLYGLASTAPGVLYGFANTSLYRLFPSAATVAGRSVLIRNFAGTGVAQIYGAAYNGNFQ